MNEQFFWAIPACFNIGLDALKFAGMNDALHHTIKNFKIKTQYPMCLRFEKANMRHMAIVDALSTLII